MCGCDYETGRICIYHQDKFTAKEREQFYKHHVAYLEEHVNAVSCLHT
jgi:hypothetical protein